MQITLKRLNFFLIFIALIYLTGCSCSNETGKKDETQNQASASNMPEGSFLEVPNESGTFILMIENPDGKETLLVKKRIYVYDKTNDEIILEDFIPQGKASWKNDTEIQIEKHPGIISKDESKNILGYIFNTSTREKTEIK